MNKIQISMSIILIKELYGIGLDMIRTQDNLYSEKTTLLSRIQTVSPSLTHSPGVGCFAVDDSMKFYAVMWKSLRKLSVSIKKNPLEENGYNIQQETDDPPLKTGSQISFILTGSYYATEENFKRCRIKKIM